MPPPIMPRPVPLLPLPFGQDVPCLNLRAYGREMQVGADAFDLPHLPLHPLEIHPLLGQEVTQPGLGPAEPAL